MRRSLIGPLALATGCVLPWPAAAHHSLTMFDFTQTLSVQGQVREFAWTNPHTYIVLEAEGRNGLREIWSIEGQSPSYLARRGWTRRTISPGDRITVVINPLKAGGRGGHFQRMVLPDGRTILQEQ